MRQPRFKRKAFKFPLSVTWHKVFTSDDGMAFDFCGKYRDDEELLVELVEIINGYKQPAHYMNLRYDSNQHTILLNDEKFIMIRGWGNLTSPNCLNYEPHKAVEIQDEFAEYIIMKLST